MRIEDWHKATDLTMREAVEKCSLTTDEMFANLLKKLADKNMIEPSDLEHIFEHEFSVTYD